MSKKFEDIIRKTIEETDTYQDRILDLMKEIEQKRINIRNIMNQEKKLLLANWIYKIIRRKTQANFLNPPHIKTAQIIESPKLPVLYLFAFFLMIFCIIFNFFHSSIKSLS